MIQLGKITLNLSPSRTYRVSSFDVSEDRYNEALQISRDSDLVIFKYIFGDRQNLASLTIILREVKKHGMQTWI